MTSWPVLSESGRTTLLSFFLLLLLLRLFINCVWVQEITPCRSDLRRTRFSFFVVLPAVVFAREGGYLDRM